MWSPWSRAIWLSLRWKPTARWFLGATRCGAATETCLGCQGVRSWQVGGNEIKGLFGIGKVLDWSSRYFMVFLDVTCWQPGPWLLCKLMCASWWVMKGLSVYPQGNLDKKKDSERSLASEALCTQAKMSRRTWRLWRSLAKLGCHGKFKQDVRGC